ncbi:MAG: hypothetical protein IPP28_10615 [Xanthomonadales bacterium]|nr:hypothetical protein [Xanthomonadales bacterium]MBP7623833.1 hypothetical protein [Xanthomonadales bacterium]
MRRPLLVLAIAAICSSQAQARLIDIPNGDATLDLATLYAVNYDPYDSAIPRRRPGHPSPQQPDWPDRNEGAIAPAPNDAVGEFVPLPDRWRIMEALGQKYPWYDPYNNNVWKGDKPIHGDDWFLSVLGVSDTVLEPRTIPTPVGAQSTGDPDSNDVFGDIEQNIFAQTFLAGIVYYKGNTTFKPPEWEYRATLAFNYNRVDVSDQRVLQIDPRLGGTRDDGFVAVQELFVDKHLRDVSDRYDFDAVRFGIQPFSTDFRGFLFQDLQFGARLFGNRNNNRWQYNLAWFRRIEKDTNSGLNDVGAGLRDDDIFVANLYRQDWPRVGFTSQATIVHNRNREDEFHFDENGFLARPSSLGTETLREYDATYLGYNGDGHFGRVNLTASAYYLFGNNIGTFTGRDSDLEAGFAAAEASMDFDWVRVRASAAYASGDRDPFDDKSQGYDAIFENPIFAGADTSYWVRQNLPLIGGGGVALAGRNSLLPSLRSSRELGQSNFENPGLQLLGLGADFDLTPESRVSANLNQLWFDDTATLEVARNQGPIDRGIGTDLSVAWIWRPFATQNAILRLSAAALIPASGLEDLYGSDDTYTTVLANVVLNY